MVNRRTTLVFLSVVAAFAVYLCYLIAKPFLNPIIAAVVIAIVFFPLHTRMQRLILQRNAAAAFTTILVLLMVMVPAVVLGMSVSKELGETYQLLSRQNAAQGAAGHSPRVIESVVRVLGRYVDVSGFDARATLLRWLEQASRYLLSIAATVVGNIFAFALDLVVAFLTLFFLFREGRRIRLQVAALLPLSPAQVEKLFTTINETVVANVHGSLAVAVAQGSLAGLAFWVLSVPSPILWGLITGVASLVPVVGSAIVWVPACIVLVVGGHWVKALLLLGWGAAVVGQVDALIRPYVMSKQVKVHTLLLFFALLGGVEAFGIMGLFIGPVVLAVTIAVLGMLEEMNFGEGSLRLSR